MQLKDNELSSGSQALGINAHPVPAVRLSLPRYWNISGRGNWLGIRGHISYGLMTDDNFMQDYLRGTKTVMLHGYCCTQRHSICELEMPKVSHHLRRRT